ncbi:MAG: acetyl-CoA carboxylase biotin carboxyl carrier protein [Candidatus Izemoplasma sp.]
MDLRQVKNLMKEFEDSNIHKLEIVEDGFTIKLEKKNTEFIAAQPVLAQQVAYPVTEQANEANDVVEEVSKYTLVKAPLVGTFYEAPNPDARPYVSVNQKVSKGDTIFLIEAMKVMNEIKAPVSGVVISINPKNASMVEYDQVVMEIDES